jgi:3-oxoacyl-[acyl-carrier protein] reductase
LTDNNRRPEHKECAIASELQNRVAVVTGSSSGLGRAIALELAAGGADVLVHARANREGALAAARAIQTLGRTSDVVLVDLAQPAGQEELIERAWQWRGAVDIWINNAGVDVLTGPLAGQDFDEKLRRLWQVDVQATVRLSRIVGQRMKQRGAGVILNMGWDQADHGMAGDSGEMFAAVKGAVMAFSRSLAQSLAPQVRVNCLAPGWIKTAWGAQASAEWQDRACRESLAGRWGTPEDVARVARFLASPASEFISGQVIPINGGLRRSVNG